MAQLYSIHNISIWDSFDQQPTNQLPGAVAAENATANRSGNRNAIASGLPIQSYNIGKKQTNKIMMDTHTHKTDLESEREPNPNEQHHHCLLPLLELSALCISSQTPTLHFGSSSAHARSLASLKRTQNKHNTLVHQRGTMTSSAAIAAAAAAAGYRQDMQ